MDKVTHYSVWLTEICVTVPYTGMVNTNSFAKKCNPTRGTKSYGCTLNLNCSISTPMFFSIGPQICSKPNGVVNARPSLIALRTSADLTGVLVGNPMIGPTPASVHTLATPAAACKHGR